MKYVALLRGINVGGNSLIKMADLKAAFEKSGFTNVRTYINSGNVIFETNENDIQKITHKLETDLSKIFNLKLRIVILSYQQLENVLADIPAAWKKGHDLRCYIAFMKDPITPTDVIKEVQLKEGVDEIKAGKKVLYMSTKLEGLTKSGLTKLITKKIYKELTMRNLNTSQKLLDLMNKEPN